MRLFSRKRRVDAVEFCRHFYDGHVFGSAPGGGDSLAVYAEVIRRQVADVGSHFDAVEVPQLAEELRAIWLEVAGTAWTHHLKDTVALAISEFTKSYIASMQRPDLWDAMVAYNSVVARSATYGADPSRPTGRGRITFVNSMRTQLFNKWADGGHDTDAAARVANRIGSDESWRAGIAQGLLAIELTKRLGVEGSEAMWTRLAAVAHGFYSGAKEVLDEVTLVV